VLHSWYSWIESRRMKEVGHVVFSRRMLLGLLRLKMILHSESWQNGVQEVQDLCRSLVHNSSDSWHRACLDLPPPPITIQKANISVDVCKIRPINPWFLLLWRYVVNSHVVNCTSNTYPKIPYYYYKAWRLIKKCGCIQT
jgi:hypothetical protein